MITTERLCLVSFGVDEDTGEPTINILKTIKWQGLTDDEIVDIFTEVRHTAEVYSAQFFARAIEQALKEKNNG